MCGCVVCMEDMCMEDEDGGDDDDDDGDDTAWCNVS